MPSRPTSARCRRTTFRWRTSSRRSSCVCRLSQTARSTLPRLPLTRVLPLCLQPGYTADTLSESTPASRPRRSHLLLLTPPSSLSQRASTRWASAASSFDWRVRCSTTDKHSSNLQAERCISNERAPVWATLHLPCNMHIISTGMGRVFTGGISEGFNTAMKGITISIENYFFNFIINSFFTNCFTNDY